MAGFPCPHVEEIRVLRAEAEGCEECLRSGDSWVHLRLCMSCGKVSCCDSSKNAHARRHSEETGHAIVASIEPGEAWRWCYIDEIAF
jgi:uncharacterized UBP type Zn finger protein